MLRLRSNFELNWSNSILYIPIPSFDVVFCVNVVY
jgi:hypothetical protein